MIIQKIERLHPFPTRIEKMDTAFLSNIYLSILFFEQKDLGMINTPKPFQKKLNYLENELEASLKCTY